MLSILDILEDTTVDGPGFRTTIYAAGCPNACPGCHNPESWDIHRGHPMSTEEILDKVLNDPFADVTFSGGDPMFQPEGFAELAQAIKEKSGKNIWCYTGYTFERLLANPRQRRRAGLAPGTEGGGIIIRPLRKRKESQTFYFFSSALFFIPTKKVYICPT